MKTNNKLSAYILRGSTGALLFSCVIVALCSAIQLPEQPPKVLARQAGTVFGANDSVFYDHLRRCDSATQPRGLWFAASVVEH